MKGYGTSATQTVSKKWVSSHLSLRKHYKGLKIAYIMSLLRLASVKVHYVILIASSS
jgi:hypothetical protein